ncbi:PaaI family thioesterase [Planomicrobium sp. CPCC 101110]|uniref:PaaI family thioesterase n=1 Tax=Planomicrobium sp. CPCC 101110 TaxID=2599619 RepID=UPI002107B2D5|nr:PaaI family thioesterase [Planomicrobium sp. CPCC 101110]
MERVTSGDASTLTIPNSALGTLANSLCPVGFGAVPTNLNIHYMAVADEPTILAEARIIRQGRHTMAIEGNIVQQDGRPVATAAGSFLSYLNQVKMQVTGFLRLSALDGGRSGYKIYRKHRRRFD